MQTRAEDQKNIRKKLKNNLSGNLKSSIFIKKKI